MALAIMIIITVLIGLTVILVFGKEDIKKNIAPLFILLISNFLFLYAKYVVGDGFLTLLIYLPALVLLIISSIWLIIFLVIAMKRKYKQNH